MCYAIASCQLLYSLPTFSRYIVENPTLKSLGKVEKVTLRALQYLAKCNLQDQMPVQNTTGKHAGAIFKNIAQKYCGLSKDDEHDPAEFISKFIQYLTEKFAFKIDRDLFETEIVADSVECQE